MAHKVVLVTGGSSGIGLATCKWLRQQGCKVYGTSRKAVNGEIKDGCTLLHLDLSDRASIDAAVAHVLKEEGRIDVLVNNAGIGFAGAVEDATEDEVRTVFQTNVFGLLACCQAVIPSMRANGGGWIINVSSIAGEFGLPFRGVYCASKSALDSFSETLRMELKPANIRVSIIQPGDVRTNINSHRLVAARARNEASPYYHSFQRIYKEISEEVASAQDPEKVAQLIGRIMDTNRPKMRYPAATFVQRLSISLNRILPKHIFQAMLLGKYPVE